jgi:hypothetical protein
VLLAVSVVAIGAAGLALTKVDDGFTDFFNSTIIKVACPPNCTADRPARDTVAA